LSHPAPSTTASPSPRPSPGSASITAFFPAYNDEATIVSLVDQVEAILAGLTDDYEVIVVDDGSVDRTGAELDELARARPSVRVFHHDRNRGYGAALRTGFSRAEKELVFYTDGDGQYDVAELRELMPLMQQGVDVVNGYKLERADGRHRAFLGSAYNRVASAAFRLPIRDVDCDFRLMRRKTLQSIELTSSSGAICVELVHKLHAAGATFVEAPVHHYPRRFGRSQFFTPKRVLRSILDVVRLWARLVASRGRARLAGPRSVKERRA
jgi:glycosyltransferase involved in cell wall biosynthesis